MSQAIFLNTDEFLEIILSEMPEGVYPTDFANDPDTTKRSVSSAELRAFAVFLETISNNLSLIYDDKFISSVTGDGLTSYEKDFFSNPQDSTLSLDIRRQNLLSKIRSTGGISLPAIRSVVAGILDPIPFDLLPYSGQAGTGAWVLGASQLGVGTWLAQIDPIIGARTENGLQPLDCNLDYADEGLTADQLLAIQSTAYSYEVRIYGNASAATLALLDSTLTAVEPARSAHIIRNSQTAPSFDYSQYIASTPFFNRLRL